MKTQENMIAMRRGDNMDDNSKFIMTDNAQLIKQLLQYGYRTIGKSENLYIFENNSKKVFNFSEIEPGKVVFTNKLFL